MIIATAGHIDHGKTALVRALTGIDTDSLPEEKARGISIDVGFAHLALADGGVAAVMDVPGHEHFVRNMLSGMYAADHVLLVVAATDGVMPQTREHLNIARLLGIGQITAVITKPDCVDAARLAQVQREVHELLAGAGYESAPAMIASPVTGAGLDQLRERLAAVAATAPGSARHAPARGGTLARFVVDRVFTLPGSGTVVRGTVMSGAVAAGDTLVISPAGVPARVRRLQRHGQAAGRAAAGERCALNLAHVEHSAVARGDWLVDEAAHHPTARFDARIRVLESEPSPLQHWRPVHLHIGAADVPARVALRRGARIEPGGEAFAQLRLARPIQAVHGDRFILRDQSATRTLGGGSVLDPFPVRRTPRIAALAALDGHDLPSSLKALLEAEPNGVDMERLARVFNVPAAEVLRAAPADALVVHTDGHTAFSGSRLSELQRLVGERVRAFHGEQPRAAGMEIARLHAELAPAIAPGVFGVLAKLVAQRCGLIAHGSSQLRRAEHDSTDNPQDALLWRRVRPLLQKAGAAIPSVRELSGQSQVALMQLRDLLHRKAAHGELVKLTAERFALPETVTMLEGQAARTAAGQPDGLFTAAQYRDAIGTGRGLAIEILECLDQRGATVRQGNVRAMHDPAARSLDNPALGH